MGCNSSVPQDLSDPQLSRRDLATLERHDDRVADSILHSAGDRAAAAAADAPPPAAASSIDRHARGYVQPGDRAATRHNAGDVVTLTDAAYRRLRIGPNQGFDSRFAWPSALQIERGYWW